MAILDTERGVLVVRIVYDGPALAGKTSSVRALASSLDRPVFSGAEAEGRTLHFDWLDYVGGLFQGYPIRCQVLSVPGQPALVSRRKRLLREADAVVFVADSREDALAEGLASFETLRTFVNAAEPPAPGIVLQANKRDAADAVPLDRLRARLAVGPTVAVTSSIAIDGSGIRETFVLAVRLALDRVRERWRTGTLESGRPESETGEELMEALRRAEAAESTTGVVASGGATWIQHAEPAALPAVAASPEPVHASSTVAQAEAPEAEAVGVRTPDAYVPGGLIWPPVEGRLVLHEASAIGLYASQGPNGDWWATAEKAWIAYSFRGSDFPEVESGRACLVTWARWLSTLGKRISPRRAIALCESGTGTWRLWQVGRREPTLRDLVRLALAEPHPDRAADGLLRACDILAEADADIAPLGLPVTAVSVGRVEGAGVCYVGILPASAAAVPETVPHHERVRAVFGPLVSRARTDAGFDAVPVLDRLRLRSAVTSAKVVETLQALLIGH
ncbi:MAG: GTPase domain-containing protein [Vicinamibacteria bacterium]